MYPAALQTWVNNSPNASTSNTLIETLGTDGKGRILYRSYHWNLCPNLPNETPAYFLPSGKQITQGTAHALLSAAR